MKMVGRLENIFTSEERGAREAPGVEAEAVDLRDAASGSVQISTQSTVAGETCRGWVRMNRNSSELSSVEETVDQRRALRIRPAYIRLCLEPLSIVIKDREKLGETKPFGIGLGKSYIFILQTSDIP
jgi:hypothetical protein